MIWAVLDTNVLVSGLGWGSGAPGEIVDRALAGDFVVVTSGPLLDELERVLAYPRIAAVISEPGELRALIAGVAVAVEPTRPVEAVERDPADNWVLEAAEAGRADFIVSGDRDLTELGAFADIPIVTPPEFLDALER